MLILKKTEFDKYVKERYESQVSWYDGRSIFYKRLNYAFQIPTIFIAAIIPIFAVLEQKWITVILAAITAIFIGILNFGKFEEQWHNYRSTCEALKKELYFHNAKIFEYREAAEPEELFVQRVESIISSEHTKWTAIEKTKGSKDKAI